MKVNIKEAKKNRGYDYPCLLISKYNKTVILAVGENEGRVSGMVLVTSDANPEIGLFSKYWDKDQFLLFEGSVELSND